MKPSEYVDMRFIVPTFNIFERLFSIAGYTINDRRKGALPSNIEMQLFHHDNARMWSVKEEDDMLQKTFSWLEILYAINECVWKSDVSS